MGIQKRLKRLRSSKGMNPTALGREAGLSRMAVSYIEAGRSAPSVDTVEKLAYALDVEPSYLAFGDTPSTTPMNHLIAPGFDPMTLSDDITALVNGYGGTLDQSHLYIDPRGAAQWRALVDSYNGIPSQFVAEAVVKEAAGSSLDVIALGVGTGHREVQFVKQLADLDSVDLRLFMVDISQPLLAAASSLAAETLSYLDIPQVTISGDFNRLPSFMHFFRAADWSARRRILCMFGYTFGNFDNEVRFVKNALSGFPVGDFLAIEVTLAYAPADQPQEVMAKDPALSRKRSPEFQRRYDDFLTGPIQRHARGVTSITVTPHLDLESCPIKGSYAIDMRAAVTVPGAATKQFSVGFSRRYEPQALAECMRQLGWRCIDKWTYGDGWPSMLLLFQKVA